MPTGTEFKGMATSREEEPNAAGGTKPGVTEPGKGDTGDKEPEAPHTEGEAPSNEEALAVARAEKEEALRVAREALRQTEAAKAYVSTLTATLKDSAERIAIARGSSPEEQQSLQERLNEDPESVLEEHYNRRTAPIVKANLENQAKIVRELAISKLGNTKLYDGGPSLWERYGDEVDQFLGQFSDPSTRAAPDAYDAAIQWVRSKHIDEEITERERARREAEKRSFVEGPSVGAAAGARKKVALNDVERAVAKGLNLSEEEYLQYKEG
jgi:hypothetical protein